MLTAILLCFTVVPASAAAQTTAAETVVQAAPGSVTMPGTGNSLISSQLFAPNALAKARVTAVTRLTDEEVEEISGRLAEHSRVYLVELQDGRRTYYMTVDFRDDDAVYFSKLVVMRATCHKLYQRSEEMAAQEEGEPKPVLMSYTHIFGELSLHYFIFRVIDSLGGEKLPGVLGQIYRKCVVADLNIDESRIATAIRLVGQLLG